MRKIAISGIPSHWHRTITGANNFATCYRESTLEVRTAAHLEHELKKISNTGNYLIGEGVRAALGDQHLQYVAFPWLTGDSEKEWIDYINHNFDFFVFSTANIFHPSFSTAREAHVFEQLNIPIIMMSAGIQSAAHFDDTYPESFQHLMNVLVEKNIFVFTRGLRTSAFLKKHGVTFAEPVGCPSNYFRPHNVRESLKKFKQVNIHDDLKINHSGYLGSVKDTVLDINLLGGNAAAYYTVQDESLLFNYKIMGDENSRAYNDTSGEITAEIEFPGKELLKKPLQHFVFFNTDQWRAWMAQVDLSLGRRFHGNMIAAQSGIPFLMISVDDRTDEMLNFMGYPMIAARTWNTSADKRKLFEEYQAAYDVEQAIAEYNAKNLNFKALLKQIGVV
jgi:hypothetical protein